MITTFSGPVRSLAGFITGTDAVGPALTASSVTITDDLNGEIIPLNRAGGMTVTLPAATGSQAVYSFVVATTFTSNGVIRVANSTDIMLGMASVSSNANVTIFGTLSASDTITMNGTTSGGVAGSFVEVRDISAGEWLVRGSLLAPAGQVPVTPFSATV